MLVGSVKGTTTLVCCSHFPILEAKFVRPSTAATRPLPSSWSAFFFLRDFIFKKTLFEKLQYLKQKLANCANGASASACCVQHVRALLFTRPLKTILSRNVWLIIDCKVFGKEWASR